MAERPQVISIKNNNGLEAQISNLGATLMSLMVPDKDKKPVNVVVGFDKPKDYFAKEYLDDYNYLGASIGRWAGRISGGSFKINDQVYNLYNEGGVHLHGGKEGFDKKYWNIDKVKEFSVTLSYFSKHLEEGYPGNLLVSVTYELTENNELKIIYKATTDKITPVNLTNHAYFNLEGCGSVLNHELELKSDKFIELDEQLLVTGKLLNTKDTPYDFKSKSKIGKSDFNGMDDIFVLDTNDDTYKVSLSSTKTGIEMKVFTNQPALVIYTPVQLPDMKFKNNAKYSKYSSICFEAEAYPDAVNQPNFPSALLNPDETYRNETVFEFNIS
ncbi:aldose epimerase family protein [Aureibaculum sp. 2210JD6-5]|uniref:aldose epimerase family protein n=1 Tax=Aureibaculum sp. 2210JD6-5 TaxID=3103957 RepID=UPI002AAEC224|nr:aldose epimerase family protein [Aureibaculum sp. 2210JD6-5]MDY7396949.1 aldose epimerase family protein [Aureibaculum sp. 2210JD6-5]